MFPNTNSSSTEFYSISQTHSCWASLEDATGFSVTALSVLEERELCWVNVEKCRHAGILQGSDSKASRPGGWGGAKADFMLWKLGMGVETW